MLIKNLKKGALIEKTNENLVIRIRDFFDSFADLSFSFSHGQLFKRMRYRN